MNLRKLFIYGLLACCALLPSLAAAQEQPEKRLVIVAADPANVPELSVRFGLFDAQGRPVRDLQARDISVRIDGEPLTTTLKLAPQQQAPAVVVVADFSAAMNDQNAPGQVRLRSMIDQIKRMLALLPADAPLSLITFAGQAQVAFDWRADVAGVRSTLDALASRPLPAAAPHAPYALTDAIGLGMEQFARNDPPIAGRSRILLVYAAGAPGQMIDSVTLNGQLQGLQPNEPTITFVGLGSSTKGEFISQPGSPEILGQAAQSLPNAAFLPFFSANSNNMPLLRNRLDRRYSSLVAAANLYKLSLSAEALSVGAHAIDITARGATATVVVQVPPLPPKIMVHVPAAVLQNSAQVRVNVTYAQRPIKQVEYFLDGRSIGIATSGSDFARTLDIEQLYAPGGPLEVISDPDKPFDLSAVATDVDGQRSEPSVGGQVWLRRPAPTLGEWLRQHALTVALAGLGIMLVIVAAGLAIGLVVVKRSRTGKHDEDPSEDSIKRDPFADRTLTISPSNGSGTIHVPAVMPGALSVTVIEGQHHTTYSLRHGREWTVGRKPIHDIHLENGQVSGDHVRLALADGGVQITDLLSTNGTFVGEMKRKLAPHRPEFVRFGELVWLGSDTKLIVDRP
jgi:hypothetical protein